MKELKQKLLDLDGVSGVGEKDGALAVYLVKESASVRAQVQELTGERTVHFVVVGDIDVRKWRD